MSENEEASKPKVDRSGFNPTVHQKGKHGDPIRNEDGTCKLKANWKEVATDRQGRKFNTKIHGDKPVLDDHGYLKVTRRRSAGPMKQYPKTTAFVNKHKEPGYAYYVMNDEGGRMDQFIDNDWEPVVTPEGRAELAVGQARSPGTKGVLMRKPIEWHQEDQRKKRELRNIEYKRNLAPKEGQYEADPSSPLR